MPRTKKVSPPSYRQHSGGQAVVTVRDRNGRRREILLGPWQSEESKAEYKRVLALLELHNGIYPFVEKFADQDTLTVDQVILAWWKEAEVRYGPDSLELENYRYALRPLRELYGPHPAAKFTPKCLKAVRQRMVDALQFQAKPVGKEGARPRWLGENKVKPGRNWAN